MISISVKFAPPTVMFLSPPPLAPAAALELEELDDDENALPDPPQGREGADADENALPAPPQAARSRPAAPTAASAPSRRRRNRGGVTVVRCCVAVMSGRLLCPVLLARVSGGLVMPHRGVRPGLSWRRALLPACPDPTVPGSALHPRANHSSGTKALGVT